MLMDGDNLIATLRAAQNKFKKQVQEIDSLIESKTHEKNLLVEQIKECLVGAHDHADIKKSHKKYFVNLAHYDYLETKHWVYDLVYTFFSPNMDKFTKTEFYKNYLVDHKNKWLESINDDLDNNDITYYWTMPMRWSGLYHFDINDDFYKIVDELYQPRNILLDELKTLRHTKNHLDELLSKIPPVIATIKLWSPAYYDKVETKAIDNCHWIITTFMDEKYGK